MKTLKNIALVALVFTMGIINTETAAAQMSDYKFAQLFDQAFELVLEGNHRQAIPMLTKLYDSDGNHGQVQYLLGMCRMNCGMVDAFTVYVLEKAAKNYSFQHQHGRVEDHTAPARAWFYLAEACSKTQLEAAAIEAYRNYMSCVPLASLDHKTMVINRIKELKNAGSVTDNGGSGILANLKP
ncbi:MAG: hypothetical protein KBF73_01040 [Flavobacteriales bacterium]|nr:hypothetical protein [Flavobacteriales bacterium]